jgi:prophage tail gpP-like protein
MAEKITLKVGGRIHEGWTSVEVNRSLETIAGSFSLGVTERYPGLQARFAIAPGMGCSLAIGGETVITGHIDDVEPSYDSGAHAIAFRGRDATGDLVDCSALVEGGGRWMGQGLETIAAAICKPFGIPVSVKASLGQPLREFHLQTGETAFEAIERMAKAYGVLPVSNGLGGLVFTRAGSGGAQSALTLGGNILKARGMFSHKDRFSRYIVLAQAAGDDYVDPSITVGGHGEATDPGVGRYRPLIIVADMPDLNANYQRRAQWEASVRAGRARKSSISVQGWRDDAGRLYRPNTMVKVDDDFTGIHDTLLISGVKLSLSNAGTVAELTVTRREAFDVIPLPAENYFDSKGNGHLMPVPQSKSGAL